MGISGKVKRMNGKAVLMVRYGAQEFPLIKSNLGVVDGYLHTGDKVYLVALATEKELAHYGSSN